MEDIVIPVKEMYTAADRDLMENNIDNFLYKNPGKNHVLVISDKLYQKFGIMYFNKYKNFVYQVKQLLDTDDVSEWLDDYMSNYIAWVTSGYDNDETTFAHIFVPNELLTFVELNITNRI